MTLVNQCCLNDHCPCKNVRQLMSLADKIRYLLAPRPCKKEDTTVERVDHGQGRLGRQKILVCGRCYVTVVYPLFQSNSHAKHDLGRDVGMMPMNPYEISFVIHLHLVDFLICGASQSVAIGGEISYFHSPETTSFDVLIVQK